MGYTHYWYQVQEIPQKSWGQFREDVIRIMPFFKAAKVELAFEYNEPLRFPEINDGRVRFNGLGGEGHETFIFERMPDTRHRPIESPNGMPNFAFCKTARKTYDLAVTTVLIIAKYHFGEMIRVSSDGDDAEWEAARRACEKVLGYGDKLHIADTDGDSELREV